jgi:signal transduction histidine kinase
VAESGARGGVVVAGGTVLATAGDGATVDIGDARAIHAGEYPVVLDAPLRLPAAPSLELARAAFRAAEDARAALAQAAKLRLQAAATLEINREICNVQDLDQLLTLVSEHCRDLLLCEVAGFALREEGATTIVWRAMSGCTTETYRTVVFPETGGVAGRAMSTGRPVVVRDFLREDGATAAEYPISFAEGLRSVVGVPLEIAGRISGCLMIGYRRVHAFTGEEVDTLSSFAAQAAIAVENAGLYESVRRERARLESVVQSIDEGLVLIDIRGRVAFANRRAASLLRLGDAAAAGLAAGDVVERIAALAADGAATRAALDALHQSVAAFPYADVRLAGAPAESVRITHFTVFDSTGERLGFGYSCRDVTFEKQVDAMKTEVISLVSHEIKTPLAMIRGYASALLDGSQRRSATLRGEYLRMIDTESARLSDLVRNMTDLSKLDAGVLDLELHETDPARLLERVARRWSEGRPARRFTVALDERTPTLRMDRPRIEQVLDNLIGNALKYSPENGAIALALSLRDGAVTFSVTDAGPGIPRSERERVFDRFYQVPAEGGRRSGSGLGLYICHGIVAAHGGRIWVEPAADGGTAARFALPAA